MSTQLIELGNRYLLPSGRPVVVVARLGKRDSWVCAYMKYGEIAPPGHGEQNRVTLRSSWLLKHATPV